MPVYQAGESSKAPAERDHHGQDNTMEQSMLNLDLSLGIGQQYGSPAPPRRSNVAQRLRPTQFFLGGLGGNRRPIEVAKPSHSSSRSNHLSPGPNKHPSLSARTPTSSRYVNETQVEEENQGDLSHYSGTHEDPSKPSLPLVNETLVPGFQRISSSGDIVWIPTRPLRVGKRRANAGWWDGAKLEERHKVAKYLEKEWRYTGKDSLKQTKQRMRERIGETEAYHLLRAKEEPVLALAIVRATASTQKARSNLRQEGKSRDIADVYRAS